jgi:hypothetical protein
MNWLKLDYGAAYDDKILELRGKYGWEGYGLYLAMIAHMCTTEKGLDTNRLASLSILFGMPQGYLQGYLQGCLEIGLFYEHEKGIIMSKRAHKHIVDLQRQRDHGSKGGKARAENDKKGKKARHPISDPSREPISDPNETLQEIREEEDIYKNKYLPDFERVWELYGRKGAKKAAYSEWKKLSTTERHQAEQHIPAYVKANEAEPQFKKDFERYLKSGTFHSAIIERNGIANKNGAPDFPWPKHINIHDAYTVMKNNTQRVDCDFPHDLARAWFRANTDWRQKYGGER